MKRLFICWLVGLWISYVCHGQTVINTNLPAVITISTNTHVFTRDFPTAADSPLSPASRFVISNVVRRTKIVISLPQKTIRETNDVVLASTTNRLSRLVEWVDPNDPRVKR